MPRVLVVDDEDRICRFLGRALRSAGYDVDCATTGPAALAAATQHEYALVILDLMLPGLHGSEVLRQMLVDRPDLRVLVLSATTGVETRVGCLEAGAVDYLAKPFAIAELLARVRSRLRESASEDERDGAGRRTPRRAADEVEAGGIRLDTRRRSLDVRGMRRPLSQREYALLLHLMQHEGTVCSREELLSDVWGYTFDPGSNIVDVYIGRLRAKLDADSIETVRNVGYCFAPR
jgi:DNA-binding response OmpR family regulator